MNENTNQDKNNSFACSLDLSVRYWDYIKFRKELCKPKRIKVLGNFIGRKVPIAKQMRCILDSLPSGFRILDIGAGDRAFDSALKQEKINCVYQSVDVEKKYPHDFNSIEEIDGNFDLITIFEVLEHLPLSHGLRFLEWGYEHLNVGGVLVISVPNPRHPFVHFEDCTHQQHWPADNLYAVLRLLGFSKENINVMYVCYTGKFFMNIKSSIIALIRRACWRILGIPFSQGIIVTARK